MNMFMNYPTTNNWRNFILCLQNSPHPRPWNHQDKVGFMFSLVPSIRIFSHRIEKKSKKVQSQYLPHFTHAMFVALCIWSFVMLFCTFLRYYIFTKLHDWVGLETHISCIIQHSIVLSIGSVVHISVRLISKIDGLHGSLI